jgi:hypothetical protein
MSKKESREVAESKEKIVEPREKKKKKKKNLQREKERQK